ncbi:MAG: hypothetical protein K1W19_10605 [Lachnospiraceae bacterium]
MSLLKNQRAAEPIDKIYQDLETVLMQNIARHLRDWKQPIDTDRWLMQKLAEIGKLNQENIKLIARTSGISQKAAEQMLNQMAAEAISLMEPCLQYLANQNLVENLPNPQKSKNVRQAVNNLKSQAKDTLNLCNTTMLYKAETVYKKLVQSVAREAGEIQNKQEFLDILNKYGSSVVVGIESRHQAMIKCIREFNQKGIPAFVDKKGREWTPEAYVNMCMRNTARQTAEEVQTARCKDAGINLIQIDSHSGARPKCAKDQGKIFSLDNTSGETQDLYGKKIKYYPWNTSSYGKPDGILGINCKHHKWPFVPEVNIQRYLPTEDFEENNRLYKQTQVQRALERDVRKQKRACMLYDELGEKEAFEDAAVKLKAKEEKLKQYVDSKEHLHRRKDREQVVGFGQGVSARAIAAKKNVAKQANMMYDIGSEKENIKAYRKDKALREKIQSEDTKKELELGQYRKHVQGSHEYEQYQAKYKKQNQYGPSYLTISQDEAQALIYKYAGTGILSKRKDGTWLNEEIITVHSETIGIAVNNLTGKSVETTVFKIKYGKNGTHIIPDYPSKKGAKAKG